MEKKIWGKIRQSDTGSNNSFDGLEELLDKSRDPEYARRLAFSEGPWHHAYSNLILVNALMRGLRGVASRLDTPICLYQGCVAEVPMHRPPHQSHLSPNGVYPVDLPVSLLLDMAEGDEKRTEEMIQALSEGAPHHVMANIITLHVAEALISFTKKM